MSVFWATASSRTTVERYLNVGGGGVYKSVEQSGYQFLVELLFAG
jgi:hypothetical protein